MQAVLGQVGIRVHGMSERFCIRCVDWGTIGKPLLIFPLGR